MFFGIVIPLLCIDRFRIFAVNCVFIFVSYLRIIVL